MSSAKWPACKPAVFKILLLLQGLFLLCLLWTAAAYAFGFRLIPPPWQVMAVWLRLLKQPLLGHAGATLLRTLGAIFLSLALALPSGLVLARKRVADQLFLPLVYLLYPVPKIALFPLALLLFGLNEAARIAVVCLVLYFQLVLEIRSGIRQLPGEYCTSLRSLGASPAQEIRYVLLPALLPRLFVALRIGTGTALAVLFFAETFFSSSGLGFFIMDSWMRIAYPEMFAGILSLGLLGALLFALIDAVERLCCPWMHLQGSSPKPRAAFSAVRWRNRRSE